MRETKKGAVMNKRSLKTGLAGLCALVLAACGEGVMDSAVRTMANEEQIALFDSVVEMLQTDDADALQAVMAEGFEDGFAQRAVDYFPNEAPDAAPFLGFRFNTNTDLMGGGRTRSLEFVRNYEYESGDYRVEMVFLGAGDEPYRLARLNIYPILEDGVDHPGAAPADPTQSSDPI